MFENTPQLAVGIAGLVSGLCFHFSPLLPKVVSIANKTTVSTEIQPSAPIFCAITFLCYFTSALYGDYSRDVFFLALNMSGYFIFVIYMYTTIAHATNGGVGLRGAGFLAVMFAVPCALIFSSYVKVRILRGVVAAVASVAVYAVKLGFEMRDVGPVSLLVSSGVMVLNGAIWCGYGVLGKDVFIAVSNGIGCGVGVAGLVLYFKKNRGNNRVGPDLGDGDGNV